MGKLLFRIARLKIMGTFVGFIVACLPFLLPIKKIAQTKNAIAFKHPAPSYPDHILIIPRKIVQTVFVFTTADFLEVIEMAVKIRHDDNRNFYSSHSVYKRCGTVDISHINKVYAFSWLRSVTD